METKSNHIASSLGSKSHLPHFSKPNSFALSFNLMFAVFVLNFIVPTEISQARSQERFESYSIALQSLNDLETKLAQATDLLRSSVEATSEPRSEVDQQGRKTLRIDISERFSMLLAKAEKIRMIKEEIGEFFEKVERSHSSTFQENIVLGDDKKRTMNAKDYLKDRAKQLEMSSWLTLTTFQKNTDPKFTRRKGPEAKIGRSGGRAESAAALGLSIAIGYALSGIEDARASAADANLEVRQRQGSSFIRGSR